MIITRHYKDQHYSTIFNTQSGFFARIEDRGWPEPQWARHGPELIDIAVTGWCDRGCTFCYRKSDTSGQHMPLRSYESLMSQAAAMGVHEVALGGGNPNQHPDFPELLRITRSGHGIVPSYTTNGRGLSKGVLQATRQYCGAVAVSAYPPYDETTVAVRKLLEAGIKTNIHFILESDSVDTALTWLTDPPAWLKGINAVIFLNFKPVTRDGNDARLAKYNPNIGRFFSEATSGRARIKVGFDYCCTTGLVTHGTPHPVSVDACDSARFSMFVSERMRAYPCSFMAELCEGHEVTDSNLLEIWQSGSLFVKMRESLSSSRCGNCGSGSQCLSGCPLFPDMNICGGTKETSPVRQAMRMAALDGVPLTVKGRHI